MNEKTALEHCVPACADAGNGGEIQGRKPSTLGDRSYRENPRNEGALLGIRSQGRLLNPQKRREEKNHYSITPTLLVEMNATRFIFGYSKFWSLLTPVPEVYSLWSRQAPIPILREGAAGMEGICYLQPFFSIRNRTPDLLMDAVADGVGQGDQKGQEITQRRNQGVEHPEH